MPDREKVVNALENCVRNGVCINCEYEEHVACKTCLMADALALLKEQEETIGNLNETVKNLLRHIEDIVQYMTPIGRVEDVKAFVESRPQIVRCKDCRYGQYCTDGETTYQCFKWNSNEFGALHEQDWFCADGERK